MEACEVAAISNALHTLVFTETVRPGYVDIRWRVNGRTEFLETFNVQSLIEVLEDFLTTDKGAQMSTYDKTVNVMDGDVIEGHIIHNTDCGYVTVDISDVQIRYDAVEFANLIAQLELPQPMSERERGIRALQKANEEAGWGFMDTDEKYWGDLYDQGVREVKP